MNCLFVPIGQWPERKSSARTGWQWEAEDRIWSCKKSESVTLALLAPGKILFVFKVNEVNLRP